MKSTFLFITGLALAFIFASCEKTGPEGPSGTNGTNGPAGPLLTGTLEGYVTHYDVSGSKMTSNLGGDTVTIDSLNITSITNTAGLYTFTGLKTGIYNVTIIHSGFGILQIPSMSFLGGGIIFHNASLSLIPVTNLTAFSASDSTSKTNVKYIYIKGTLPLVNYNQSVIVYVSNPGSTLVNSLPVNESSSYVITINPGVGTFSKLIQMQDFYDLQYNPGVTVYFAAYIIGASTGSSSYTDPASGKTIYTALSSTPLFSNSTVE